MGAMLPTLQSDQDEQPLIRRLGEALSAVTLSHPAGMRTSRAAGQSVRFRVGNTAKQRL